VRYVLDRFEVRDEFRGKVRRLIASHEHGE